MDGSNVTSPLTASLFDFIKHNFINDLQEDTDIIKIKNAEGVKEQTGLSGEAFVEFLMEMAFQAKGFHQEVK